MAATISTWTASGLPAGLAIDAAINALKTLAPASAFRRTAAGSEPPSVGRAPLPAADFKPSFLLKQKVRRVAEKRALDVLLVEILPRGR